MSLVLSLINLITFVLCVQSLMASGRNGRPRAKPALEDATDFMGMLREVAYEIREQVAVAHQMIDQLGRQLEGGQGGNPNGSEVDLDHLKFAEFRKMNSPGFRGAFNPDKVEEWIKEKEKVFSVLAYTD